MALALDADEAVWHVISVTQAAVGQSQAQALFSMDVRGSTDRHLLTADTWSPIALLNGKRDGEN